MVRRRVVKVAERAVIVLVLVAALAGLTSCSRFPPLASDARNALLDHWGSLPSAPGIEYRITRAWRGDLTTLEAETRALPLEVWCVEAETSAPADPALDGERQVWIVTRARSETRWTAYLLAAMSSTWPYEACGEGI